MKFEAFTEAARQRSNVPTLSESALTDALLLFFSRLTEPPLYARRADPARSAATALLADAEVVWCQAQRIDAASLMPWKAALTRHIEALCATSEGEIEAALRAWELAVHEERTATQPRRLVDRPARHARPVYDRTTGHSRFDAHDSHGVELKLVCPLCRALNAFTLPDAVAEHDLDCPKCRQRTLVHLGTLRTMERSHSRSSTRVVFRIDSADGQRTRIETSSPGPLRFEALAGHQLAFAYAPNRKLLAVMNLTNSTVWWLSSQGACFVATAIFGEASNEVRVLRAFRDRTLVASAPGRAFVRVYYRHGHRLVHLVKRYPALERVARRTVESRGHIAAGRRGT